MLSNRSWTRGACGCFRSVRRGRCCGRNRCIQSHRVTSHPAARWPMDDFTDQPEPTDMRITDHAAQVPAHPALQQPRSVYAKNDVLGYVLVVLGVLVLTVLMAVDGGGGVVVRSGTAHPPAFGDPIVWRGPAHVAEAHGQGPQDRGTGR